MIPRIERQALYKLQPKLPEALRGLEQAAKDSGLEIGLIELAKVRASQINGCAFCVDMHASDARRFGETQQRLDLLAVWREAPCFTPRERAALAWTEALTLLAQAEDKVPDALYAEVSSHFSEAELANLTAVIVVINGWNRVAVSFRFQPPARA